MGLALDHGGKHHAKDAQKLDKESGEGDNKDWGKKLQLSLLNKVSDKISNGYGLRKILIIVYIMQYVNKMRFVYLFFK